MSKQHIYLVPFSHLDLFWLGQREECLSRGSRIIRAALDIMRTHPDFRFLLEDMVFVDYFLSCHPEQAAELRQQVQAGRVEVGAKWAGIYQQFFPGETLVRNLLYGKQFVREHFGVEPDTVHFGDIPGYVPQYAQVAAKGGIRGIVICRGGPDDQVLFRWRAPDGSTTLVWNALRGYPWSWYVGLHRSLDEALAGRERRGRVHPPLDEDARQIMALTPAPIFMHWGIDLVSPTERLVENVHAWTERTGLPMRFATPSEYFRDVAQVAGIPTLSGEIPSVWPTVEAGSPAFWYLSSPANYALIQGENWAELARRLGFGAYDRLAVKQAWKAALQGMDHNWGGTGSADTDRRHREYLLGALFAGEEMRRKAAHQIAESVKLPPVKDMTPIVVFNSCSWQRTDVVTAHASFYGEVESFYGRAAEFGDSFRCLRLYDHTGREVPFQYLAREAIITREATICFTATDVPPFGYRLYYLAPAADDAPDEPLCQVTGLDGGAAVVIENDRFRLEMQRPSGRISLFDKSRAVPVATDMDLIAEEDVSGLGGGSTGRLFYNAIERVDIAGNGRQQARLCIWGSIGANRTLQEWIISRDSDSVEVVDHVFWSGHPSRIFIKRSITVGAESPQVTYGLPFGANVWENAIPRTGPHLRDEPPAATVHAYRQPLHWIDASNERGGVTIATERHAVEREGSVLRIAMLHGSAQGDLAVDWGDQHFTTRTRLRSHDGDWRSARSYRDGLGLMWPLFAVSVADPLSTKRLAPVASLCTGAPDNVIVTTIKGAESGDATVVRGFEAAGELTPATIQTPWHTGSMYEVDMLEERPLAAGAITWHAHEIKTIMLGEPVASMKADHSK